MALPAVLISILGPILGNVLDKVIPDKDAREAAKEEITEAIAGLDQKVIEGQLRINEMQAAHQSLFVAGGRPAAMWLSVIGLAYQCIIYPNLIWVCRLQGWPEPPPIDSDILMTLAFSLLGLAGIRGYEKSRGVARAK